MLDIYESNSNLELLAEIINRYESNRCGLDFEDGLNPEEILHKNRIYNNILLTIDRIKNDNELIIKFLNIINHESSKFNLIKETVGERAHKFDLIDDVIKAKLEELNKRISHDIQENLSI